MIWVTLALLLGLLALSLPVAAVLGVVGLALDQLYSFLPLRLALGELVWGATTDVILVAIPMFVLLGEILLRAGIAERMYAAMTHWLSWLPGGLMHSNIGACTLFSAVCGSSVATAATIGTVAIEQIDRYGYNQRFFLGTIAAGGTLGILIPPSINMIVYGVLTETSIPQLYLAGFLPGLVLALLFMADRADRLRAAAGLGRRADRERLAGPLALAARPRAAALDLRPGDRLDLRRPRDPDRGRLARRDRGARARRLARPPVLADAARHDRGHDAHLGHDHGDPDGRLLPQLRPDLDRPHRPGQRRSITGLGLTPMQTLLAVVGFYLVLGMFMETLTMMVATVPIITPVIIAQGFDPVWFGVLMMLLIETAMITPPVGINLFVVQGVRGRGQLHDVMLGAAPFVVTLLVMIGLLILFPQIALWLPELLSR